MCWSMQVKQKKGLTLICNYHHQGVKLIFYKQDSFTKTIQKEKKSQQILAENAEFFC